jgi:hypothetical protein
VTSAAAAERRKEKTEKKESVKKEIKEKLERDTLSFGEKKYVKCDILESLP